MDVGEDVSWRVLALLALAVTVACGAEGITEANLNDGSFPDVVGVEVRTVADGTYTFDVTISSPYDTPERYADAWRVRSPDGTVFGIRELFHDHANEQPFTRSLTGVEIPPGVETVVVEGRDRANGWGGTTMTVDLP